MPSFLSRGKLYPTLLIFCCCTIGCMKVGPDYARPRLAVADNWQDAADKRVTTQPEEQRDWWRAFGDPVLDRLIETAYRENLPLRVAGVRVLEARAQLGIVVGEGYPQTQRVFGSAERLRFSQRSPQSAFNNNLSYYTSEIGLRASWELDFWGKFRRGIEAADASLDATIADYDSTLVSLTGDVASFYVLIRTLEKRLDIARNNVETQQESLKIAEARFRHGTTTERGRGAGQDPADRYPGHHSGPGNPTAPGQECPQRPAGAAAESAGGPAGWRQGHSRAAAAGSAGHSG